MDFYLSELLDDPIYNESKEKIGFVKDLVVGNISDTHPRIKGLVIRRGLNKEAVFIPEYDIAHLSPKLVRLSTNVVDLQPFIQRNDEVLLAQDVYDKQIVDIDDRRLTRVNDLLLEEDHHVLSLKGVDISAVGVLLRLHLPNIGNLLKRNIVDWEDVQFLGGSDPMKFKVQYQKLESLHPVDIARIIFEGPGYQQGSRVLASLTDTVAARTIVELSPKLQKNLIESMNPKIVANVVEHMPAHKAADLLVTLGPDMSQKIIPLVNQKHVQKIQVLLNYPELSTGAYMTIDYLAVPQEITIEQVLTRIRNLPSIPDFAYYIYVLENGLSNKLAGVLSTHDLFKADLRTRVASCMTKKYIVAHPHDPIRESLKKMYRYNISALPVVSKNEGTLIGIVTFRDSISLYLPKRWKTLIRNAFVNNT